MNRIYSYLSNRIAFPLILHNAKDISYLNVFICGMNKGFLLFNTIRYLVYSHFLGHYTNATQQGQAHRC